MKGPSKTVTKASMAAVDLSKQDDPEMAAFKAKRALEEKKKEFLSGADDDLGHLGFYGDDEKIDFSNFKKKINTAQLEEEGVESYSLFSKFTNAFKNITGNKVLNRQDLEPILKEMSDNLTDKNVSSEIA